LLSTIHLQGDRHITEDSVRLMFRCLREDDGDNDEEFSLIQPSLDCHFPILTENHAAVIVKLANLLGPNNNQICRIVMIIVAFLLKSEQNASLLIDKGLCEVLCIIFFIHFDISGVVRRILCCVNSMLLLEESKDNTAPLSLSLKACDNLVLNGVNEAVVKSLVAPKSPKMMETTGEIEKELGHYQYESLCTIARLIELRSVDFSRISGDIIPMSESSIALVGLHVWGLRAALHLHKRGDHQLRLCAHTLTLLTRLDLISERKQDCVVLVSVLCMSASVEVAHRLTESDSHNIVALVDTIISSEDNTFQEWVKVIKMLDLFMSNCPSSLLFMRSLLNIFTRLSKNPPNLTPKLSTPDMKIPYMIRLIEKACLEKVLDIGLDAMSMLLSVTVVGSPDATKGVVPLPALIVSLLKLILGALSSDEHGCKVIIWSMATIPLQEVETMDPFGQNQEQCSAMMLQSFVALFGHYLIDVIVVSGAEEATRVFLEAGIGECAALFSARSRSGSSNVAMLYFLEILSTHIHMSTTIIWDSDESVLKSLFTALRGHSPIDRTVDASLRLLDQYWQTVGSVLDRLTLNVILDFVVTSWPTLRTPSEVKESFALYLSLTRSLLTYGIECSDAQKKLGAIMLSFLLSELTQPHTNQLLLLLTTLVQTSDADLRLALRDLPEYQDMCSRDSFCRHQDAIVLIHLLGEA
jgi:hypothetical protein